MGQGARHAENSLVLEEWKAALWKPRSMPDWLVGRWSAPRQIDPLVWRIDLQTILASVARADLIEHTGCDPGSAARVWNCARSRRSQRPRRHAARSVDGGVGKPARRLCAGGRQIDAESAGTEPAVQRGRAADHFTLVYQYVEPKLLCRKGKKVPRRQSSALAALT
jgi:hypothetical protein